MRRCVFLEGTVGKSSVVKVLAWIMVVVFPASMVMADAASAMLSASGKVTVNGARVDRSTAVFPGDKIQTGADSMATLTAQGSSVLVPGNSTLIMSENEVDVACGTAVVNTVKGMGARIHNLTVAPAQRSARFQITQDEGRLQIIAREGALAVNNGGSVSSLLPGRMLSLPASCMSADDANSNPSSGRRGAAPPPPTGGTSTGAAVLAGIGVAALAGIVVWLTTRGETSTTSTTLAAAQQ